jgi:hypothetical protein
LKVRAVVEKDYDELIQLISRFRESLAIIRSKPPICTIDNAKKELSDYLSKEFAIFIAENNNNTLLPGARNTLQGSIFD